MLKDYDDSMPMTNEEFEYIIKREYNRSLRKINYSLIGYIYCLIQLLESDFYRRPTWQATVIPLGIAALCTVILYKNIKEHWTCASILRVIERGGLEDMD